MIWAINDDNIRIGASPKVEALCPVCKSKVISKCGLIKVWHWAHKNIEDCDSFAEPESEWHKKWKDYFPKEMQEVVIQNHRADIQLPSGIVLEFQNSPLSSPKIQERELCYKDMMWILNGETLCQGLIVREVIYCSDCNRKVKQFPTRECSFCNNRSRFYIKSNQNIHDVTIRWKNPPKSWWSARSPLYVDLGSSVLEIVKLFPSIPCGGYGKLYTKETFLELFKLSSIK